MLNTLFNLAHYNYVLAAWPPIIVGLCTFVVGSAVLLHERGSRVSTAFWALCVSIAVWLCSFGVMYLASDRSSALLWGRLANVGVVFIPSILFYFTLMVVRQFHPYRWWARLGLLLSGLSAAFIIGTSRVVDRLISFPWGVQPHYTKGSVLWIGSFFIFYVVSLLLYWKAFRRFPAGPQRFRLKTLFFAFCVGLLATIDSLASAGLSVYPLGYLPAYAAIVLLAQIIWTYRFPDITPAFAAGRIIETMPSALFVLDHDGAICIVNQMACSILGENESHLLGRPIQDVLKGFLSSDQMADVLTQRTPFDRELTVSGADGVDRLLSLSASAMMDSNGRATGIVCVGRDITRRREIEQALRTSEARFKQLVESNIIGFMITDLDGHVYEANGALLQLLGYSQKELTHGGMSRSAFSPAEYEVVNQWMVERLRNTGFCPPIEKEYIRKDGQRVPVLVGAVMLEGTKDRCLCFVIDATERRAAQEALRNAYDELEIRIAERTAELREEVARRRQAEDALRNQTITDSLTGLYNRRGFLSFAEQHLQLARRERTGLLLFMADLDHLKPINDTYGHPEGDRAIVQAAAILKSTFRASDIVARVGGDEFSVAVLEDPDHEATVLAQRLQDNINEFNRTSGLPYKIGLSMGVVRMDQRELISLQNLIGQADSALYKQKRSRQIPAERIA